jgi:LPS sulfotransferase NodH
MTGSKNNDFVVISTQRTGSTWFIDLFQNCENTEGHQELFYRFPRTSPPESGFNEYGRYCELNPKGIRGLRPFSVWRYLSNLYVRPGTVGFKLQYSHFKRFPEILLFLRLKKIKVIHLVRANSLDIVISQELFHHTGTSHATSGGTVRDVRFSLDPTDCIQRIIKIEKKRLYTRKFLSILFPDHLEISYESLVDDNKQFCRVVDYLRLTKKHDELNSSLVKRQTSDRRELIDNFQEIEDALKDAGMQKYLS